MDFEQEMDAENLTPAERMRRRKAQRLEQERQAQAAVLEAARLQHVQDKLKLHEKLNDSQDNRDGQMVAEDLGRTKVIRSS